MKREPKRTEEVVVKRQKMRAAPNWETMDPNAEDTPDRYFIPKEIKPEGMSFQWVTETIYGQPVPERQATFAKGGWTPVHNDDFDGQFDGRWLPKGSEEVIRLDGMILMARPQELTDKALIKDRRKAMEQVAIKEAALRGGDLPSVTLDAGHETALRSNRISKSFERIEVPKE